MPTNGTLGNGRYLSFANQELSQAFLTETMRTRSVPQVDVVVKANRTFGPQHLLLCGRHVRYYKLGKARCFIFVSFMLWISSTKLPPALVLCSVEVVITRASSRPNSQNFQSVVLRNELWCADPPTSTITPSNKDQSNRATMMKSLLLASVFSSAAAFAPVLQPHSSSGLDASPYADDIGAMKPVR